MAAEQSYNVKELLPQLKNKAKEKRKENQKFFRKLKSLNPKVLDKKMNGLHEEVFACTDCLECANCCTTTGPLITQKDVSRLAKYLRIKPAQFEDEYTRIDEDGDRVFQSMPCPFLGADNYCSVYEHRPKACREYPHTDRIKQAQILEITRKNVSVCPAVYEITERLKASLK
jgi:Fe-S-cluster containining protein